MRVLQAPEEVTLQQLSYDTLVKRLEREKKARLEAEAILEARSLDLFRANQELAASTGLIDGERALLGAVFDARPAALVLTNSALEIDRLNARAEALFGVSASAVQGTPLPDLLAGTKAFRDWLHARAETAPPIDDGAVEGLARHMSGTDVPVRVSCTMIDYRDLRLWVIIDIRRQLAAEAERKRLELSLAQAQKMEALGTLASGVAHEINTPIQYVGDNIRFLQSVCGAIHEYLGTLDSLIGDESEPDLPREVLEKLARRREELDIDFLLDETPQAIEQSIYGLNQVASIVAAIQDFSHPGDTQRMPVDMNAVIGTTLSMSRNSWKNVAEVEQDLAADLPPVFGHAGDLHQVVLNLVANARDAIEEHRPPAGGCMRITTTLECGDVVVRVSDNGTGIREANRNRIFDPFFTTKSPGKGTGQGLAIVYKIVNVKHGGQVTVDSVWGEGATFTIRLPVGAGT
ncbi:MAG: hypothetical protein Tsb0019_24390 [Roseibium sp.]